MPIKNAKQFIDRLSPLARALLIFSASMATLISVALILFPSSPAMRPSESVDKFLQMNECVAHMASNGEALAIAVSYLPPFGKGPGLPKQEGGVILVQHGKPPIRTPLQVGAMRSIVATPSGFLAARVTYDKDANDTAYFFEVDLEGRVTELPPLEIDLVGLWVTANGEIHAYSPQAVFRRVKTNPTWERVPLDPAVNSEAIRRIVTLKDGASLIVTDRLIKGFRNLQMPPVFVNNMNTYPKPIDAYGDDNNWWIVTRDGQNHKISLVLKNGDTKEVASTPVWLIKRLLFGSDKVFVVCAPAIHQDTYYVLNRDGSGKLRGPFSLPDGTIVTCLWGETVMNGGYESRERTPLILRLMQKFNLL